MPEALYTSFFTPEYEPDALQLIETLEQFGLKHHIVPRRSKGNWAENCGMKPWHLLEVSRKFDRHPLVWLDADARVRSAPLLFMGQVLDGYDFAAWRIPDVFSGKKKINPNIWGGDALASGTMWFAPGEKRNELFALWGEACQSRPHVWDQQVLQSILFDIPIKAYWLPQSYCKVFDRSWRDGQRGPVVIEHTQASRRLKRRAGK